MTQPRAMPARARLDEMREAVRQMEADTGKTVKAVRSTRSGAIEVEFFEPREEQQRPAWSAR